MTDAEMITQLNQQLIAANAKIEAVAAKLAADRRLLDELWCYAVGAFVDGQFTGEKHEAFCRHLVRCKGCQAETEELMQLAARLSTMEEKS